MKIAVLGNVETQVNVAAGKESGIPTPFSETMVALIKAQEAML